MLERELISSGSPFERKIGYSRAVVAGDWVFVSGTTGFAQPCDLRQCRGADRAVLATAGVLDQAGSSLPMSFAQVILTRREEFEPIWPVLQRNLGEVRPASTMIVAGLADPRMLIEIEVTALKSGT
jgi:enamine deaminase RidA (YjgF/YER057c/UK114 family)